MKNRTNLLAAFAWRFTAIALLPALGQFPGNLNAQGIGFNNSNATANSSAMIDISSGTGANRGLLIPRVTAAQRTGANFNPLAAPCQGLTVYQTDNTAPGEGYYFNTSTTTTPNWVKIGSTAWGLNGNSGTTTGTNFLGTTDAQGLDIRTSNAVRVSILSGGNVGIGATNPAVKLAVNGNGTNVYNTDMWIENNLHVQGNENLTVGGRGRLRVGTAWSYVGLYAESNSAGTANDLILGSSSGTVRIGPGGVAHKLLLPASTGFQMMDNAGPLKIMISDASGNGTWQPISAAMQIYTKLASQTSITTGPPPTWTQVTNLSQSVTINTNSWVVINTTGSLENQSFSSGVITRTIISLAKDGVSLQEQATDIVNNTSPAVNQMVEHWGITHAMTLTPGTYVFSVRGSVYTGSGAGFYAGGANTTSLPNDGALTIEVYPQ